MPNAIELYRIYRDTGFLYGLYAWIKLKICPLLQLEKYVPKEGKIMDLGCGVGLFTNIMALGSSARFIEASDISAKKINIAKKTIGHRKNIRFSINSMQNFNDSSFDAIVVTDALYLIPFAQQEQILRQCFRKLSGDRLLLIKEVDTSPYWKYFLNLIQETIVVKLFKFSEGDSFFFRSSADYKNLLSKIGFEVKVTRLDKDQTYPHIVYICKKRIDAGG